MTINDVLKKAGHRLRLHDIDHPYADAELLLAHALSKPREFLITHPEKTVSQTNVLKFEKLLERRKAHEPIAYLLGYKEFYGRAFVVSDKVLIPRPETEILIESVLEAVKEKNIPTKDIAIFDVGTGSGCIALTLAAEWPDSHALAVDISDEALHVAERNAIHLGLEARTTFAHLDISDTTSEKPNLPPHAFLALTANLPYLPDFSWDTRARGIKDHEPVRAFVSGADGLNHYRALLRQLKSWKLTPDIMLFEADPHQFEPLAKLVRGAFKNHQMKVIKDLRGLDRILLATKK